jgi:hypothetical protein
LEISPYSYSHLIFNKRAKNKCWRKRASSTNGAGNTGYPHRRLKFEPDLSACTKINLKWIKNLNVKPETLKLLQENIQETLKT